MRWLTRERGKAGITIAGVLLLLVLMVWVPVSVAGAYGGAHIFPGKIYAKNLNRVLITLVSGSSATSSQPDTESGGIW